MKFLLTAAAGAAWLWAGMAHAAIIQVSGTFFASGIQPFNGSVPPPFDNVSGQFKLHYDDQAPGSADLLSFSMDLGATHYDRFNSGAYWHVLSPPNLGDRRIRMGGLLNGVGAGSPGTDDFVIGMDFDGGNWLSGFLTYNSSLVSPLSGTSSWAAGSQWFQPGDFAVSIEVSEAPVPGAGLLLLSGIGLAVARRVTAKKAVN